MYNRTYSLIGVLSIASIVAAMPIEAQAQVKVAQAKSTQQVRILLDEGSRLVKSGDFNGAIKVYQEASSLEPKNGSIYSGIGYLYAQQRNYPAALAAYRRA
ncbi:MAG: tetratricopeptide repeat protein, partial [Rivularia sp. (in: cyanobacteria)]